MHYLLPNGGSTYSFVNSHRSPGFLIRDGNAFILKHLLKRQNGGEHSRVANSAYSNNQYMWFLTQMSKLVPIIYFHKYTYLPNRRRRPVPCHDILGSDGSHFLAETTTFCDAKAKVTTILTGNWWTNDYFFCSQSVLFEQCTLDYYTSPCQKKSLFKQVSINAMQMFCLLLFTCI